jgi:hypothetical protein
MEENKAAVVSPSTVQLPKPQPMDGNGPHPEGVVHVASNSSLSKDLLKAPTTFNDAPAWTNISLRDVESAKQALRYCLSNNGVKSSVIRKALTSCRSC